MKNIRVDESESGAYWAYPVNSKGQRIGLNTKGQSPSEAIGKLILACPELFSIRLVSGR